MDFRLSADQRDLQAAARDFARAELPAIAAICERDNTPPSHDLVRRYAELGFLGINVPEALGGLGLGNLEALIVLEEFAKISSAVAFPIFESSVGPVRAIERFGSEALQRRIVPAVCRGEMVIAIGMSEPDAGSALTDLKTRGVIRGDKVVINGTKRWCSGGGHADAYLVYCRLSDDPGPKAIGAVLVEKGTPGLSFGPPEQLMGFRGVPSSDLMFDDVEVPIDNVVVPAGGFKKLMEAFDLERCGNATMALGQASGALEDVTGYVQERKQFGHPVSDFQGLQFMLADMGMKIEAARQLTYAAAGRSERGDKDLTFFGAAAKAFASDTAMQVTTDAVQLLGGYGFTSDYPLERMMRDAKITQIYEGTNQVQRVVMARQLLAGIQSTL